MRAIDFTGQVRGRVTVLHRLDGEPGHVWQCLCDCGRHVALNSAQLRGRNPSCGCGRKRTSRAKMLEDDLGLWRRVVLSYRGNAKKRGIRWELTEAEAIALLKEDCTYCLAPPATPVFGKIVKDRAILTGGIDRSDNTIGYTSANSVPCCRDCNVAKRDRTVDQFLIWAHRLARNTVEPSLGKDEFDWRDAHRSPVIADVLAIYDQPIDTTPTRLGKTAKRELLTNPEDEA